MTKLAWHPVLIDSTMDATLSLGASEDFLNKAIRIGLYLSATFQVICLTTIIFLPAAFLKSFSNGWDGRSKRLDESDDTSSEHSTPQNDPKQRHHQRRKQEKKKRK
ncbi:hypothetical protein DMENIID0001_167800 [Sergentomyia squamirostris]